MAHKRTSIRVGQRLIYWDGTRGYVDLNTQGTRVYGPGEAFKVVHLDDEGNPQGAEYYTMETLEADWRFGRGVMPWAR